MYQHAKRFETSATSGILSRAKDRAAAAADEAGEFMDAHPASLTLLAFGVGLAVGLSMVALLPTPRSNVHRVRGWLGPAELKRLIEPFRAW